MPDVPDPSSLAWAESRCFPLTGGDMFWADKGRGGAVGLRRGEEEVLGPPCS